MRKIIISEFISLDGIFEAPGADGSAYKYAGWTSSYVNDEFMKFKSEELFAAGALLLGRVTYDGFAAAWPKVQGAGEFGEKMNSVSKYVVSGNLEKAEWNNSTVLKGDVVKEITALKEQEGQDILVFGSGVLSQTLLDNDLVDELRLLVYPVILGTGKKFFKEGKKIPLQTLEARAFKTGIVLLRHQPVRA